MMRQRLESVGVNIYMLCPIVGSSQELEEGKSS